MPDYGLYQLSNSREIPRFVGSAVPELTQASQIMQNRYDTSLQFEDAIDQGIKQATSLGQDVKHLQELKDKYRARLAERAKKGDYENMMRETSRDARDFVNEYKPIAQNQQLYSEYQKRLNEQVEKGEVTPDRAAKMLDYATKSYKGLQRDPVTGQLRNQFQGRAMVKDLNMAEWVDKQLIGLHPTTTGSTIQKDVNGYYRLQGSKKVRLDYDKEIKPILDAAKRTDPMYRAWVDQETLLDSYNARYVPEAAIKQSQLYPQLQQIANQQGISLNEALQMYQAQRKYGEIEQTLDQMGRKYQRNDIETEYRDLGETADTKRRKDAEAANKGKVNFGITYAANDDAGNIASETDFNGVVKNTEKDLDRTRAEYTSWLYEKGPDGQPLRKVVGGGANTRFLEKQADGTWADVTSIGNKKQDAVNFHIKQSEQLKQVQQAAAKEAGWDPYSKEVKDKIENEISKLKIIPVKNMGVQLLNLITDAVAGNTVGLTTQLMRMPREHREAVEKIKEDVRTRLLQDDNRYYTYEAALKNRLNGGVAPNEMLYIRDEDAQKSLKNLLTGISGDGVGFKKGMAPLTIGSGKDQGAQLTPEEYDAIAGDLVPVGVINEMDDGSQKVIFRTTQNVKGKKVEGENLILEANTITGLDDYLKKNLPARDYVKFRTDSELKAQFGQTKSGIIRYTAGVDEKGNPVVLDIVRERNNKTNKFRVYIPSADGTKRIEEVGTIGSVADLITMLKTGE